MLFKGNYRRCSLPTVSNHGSPAPPALREDSPCRDWWTLVELTRRTLRSHLCASSVTRGHGSLINRVVGSVAAGLFPGRDVADHDGAVSVEDDSTVCRRRDAQRCIVVQEVARTAHVAGSRTGSPRRSALRCPPGCACGADAGTGTQTSVPADTIRWRSLPGRVHGAMVGRPSAGFDRMIGMGVMVVRWRPAGRARAPATSRRGGQLCRSAGGWKHGREG
jgi:hypothetical protein